MSKMGVVHLESYRLAQYATPIECYICSEDNGHDAELCQRCQAPLALARQTEKLKEPPKMVGVLGASGAGKTVYLGMLSDMLTRDQGQLRFLARGAFSISLQQVVMGALSHCHFPKKTPNEPDRWHWLHCQVKTASRKRPIELIMPDVAGEAVLEELDHPGAYPALRSFLSKCCAVMILIDVEEVEAGEQSQDFFTMKLISYLCELNGDKKRGWPTRPMSFVFTKADQCESCFDDPDGYAMRHTPGIWRQCTERFPNTKFFAAGVAGACAFRKELDGRVVTPLRVEPRGVVPPFVWLIERLGK